MTDSAKAPETAATPPSPPSAAPGDATRSTLVLGLGMLGFGAAIALYATVRLGWWEPVRPPEPPTPARPSLPASTPPTGTAEPATDDPARMAFGSLAGEVSGRHDDEFYSKLAEYMSAHGEPKLAARMYGAARRACPADDAKRRLALLQMEASALWAAGARPEAVAALREEIGRVGNDPSAAPLWQAFGAYSLELNQTEDAFKAFRDLSQYAPSPRERDQARTQLWRLYVRTGKAATVLEAYVNKLAESPDHEESLRMCLAYHTHIVPDPKKADEMLAGLVKLHPDDTDLAEIRLQALAARKATDELLALVDALAAKHPQRAAYFYNQAVTYLVATGDLPKARALVRQALEKDPHGNGPTLAALFYRNVVKEPAAAAEQYAVARRRATAIEAIQKYQLEEADCRLAAGQFDAAEALARPLIHGGRSGLDRNRAAVMVARIEQARNAARTPPPTDAPAPKNAPAPGGGN